MGWPYWQKRLEDTVEMFGWPFAFVAIALILGVVMSVGVPVLMLYFTSSAFLPLLGESTRQSKVVPS